LFESKTYHKKADDLLEKIMNENLEIIFKKDYYVEIKVGQNNVSIWTNYYKRSYGYVWKLNDNYIESSYQPCAFVKSKFKRWLSTKPNTDDPLFKVMKD
jgi:hypothetical protein